MTTLFHTNEIVQFAIEKEEESYKLYSKLAQRSDQPAVKALFNQLAEEELKHKSFYEVLSHVAKDSSESHKKEPEEFDAYMRELIRSSRQVAALNATDFADIRAIIQYAIAREKDSILFYTGLMQYLPANEHEAINGIIKEEAKHVAMLTEIGGRIKNED